MLKPPNFFIPDYQADKAYTIFSVNHSWFIICKVLWVRITIMDTRDKRKPPGDFFYRGTDVPAEAGNCLSTYISHNDRGQVGSFMFATPAEDYALCFCVTGRRVSSKWGRIIPARDDIVSYYLHSIFVLPDKSDFEGLCEETCYLQKVPSSGFDTVEGKEFPDGLHAEWFSRKPVRISEVEVLTKRQAIIRGKFQISILNPEYLVKAENIDDAMRREILALGLPPAYFDFRPLVVPDVDTTREILKAQSDPTHLARLRESGVLEWVNLRPELRESIPSGFCDLMGVKPPRPLFNPQPRPKQKPWP
jgi:hypothetical protein